MSIIKEGYQTLRLDPPPRFLSFAAIAGPEAARSPVVRELDAVLPELRQGRESFERSEQQMLERTLRLALSKAGVEPQQAQLLCCGDLINQITPSCLAARSLQLPFMGLFAACATMGEALAVAAVAAAGGAADPVLAAASSHVCTAEKQFRYPNEYGSQKPPYAQVTFTACGAALLSGAQGAAENAAPSAPMVTHLTLGRVADAGLTDPFQVGAAMAPAFADTVAAHLRESGRTPQDYDLILSGDLGRDGLSLARQLLQRQGIDLTGVRLLDCGLELSGCQDRRHAGASGAGCAAAYLCGPLLRHLQQGGLPDGCLPGGGRPRDRAPRVLLAPTGALFSPLTTQQGESIPAICHTVAIEGSDV